MALTLISGPAQQPVTLAEARLHLRLDASGDPPTHPEDSLVEMLITATTGHLDGADGVLRRALVTQRWRLSLGAFPIGAIKLPLPPLQSVEAVSYVDADGEEQSFADYAVDPAFGCIRGAWPSGSDVRIDFTAGYGGAGNVPAPLKAAILLHVGHLYANREAVNIGNITTELPLAYDALIYPYRLISL